MKDLIIRAEAGDKHVMLNIMPLLERLSIVKELATYGEIELKLVDAVSGGGKISPFLPEDFSESTWKEMLGVNALISKYANDEE